MLRVLVVIGTVAAGIVLPRPALAAESTMVTDSSPVPVVPTVSRSTLGAASLSPTSLPVTARAVDLDPFVSIGFEWRAPAAAEGSVRVRTDGEWSGWEHVHVDEGHEETDPDAALDAAAVAEDPAESPATSGAGSETFISDPLWVGAADGWDVRLPADATDVVVHLVREGREQVNLTLQTAEAEAAAVSTTVNMRSSWGARDSRREYVVADDVDLAVVHHSGVAAHVSYTPEQVPAILRSMQAYHMDARGWNDLGYNFAIDRFGRIWEGRGGGISRAIVGGHASGFNTASTGVVLIGDFARTPPTNQSIDALVQLLTWKLFVHGADPRSRVTYQSLTTNDAQPKGRRVNVNRIVGHRDVGQTTCPGGYLYARLPEVRQRVSAAFGALPGRGVFQTASLNGSAGSEAISGDFDGDGIGDVFHYTPGSSSASVWYGNGGNGVDTRSVDLPSNREPLVGDFDGDGRTDLFFFQPGHNGSEKVLWGRADRSFARSDVPDVGGDFEPLVGDFNGGGVDDIFWYAPGSAIDYVWYGGTNRTFRGARPTNVGGTFEPFVGDFDGGGIDDIFWYAPGPGVEYVWYGEADRSFTGRRAPSVGGTYQTHVGDFDGIGGDDILWYAPGRTTDYVFRGGSGRTFSSAPTAPLNGSYEIEIDDFDGGGTDDIVFYRPSDGRATLWLGTATGRFMARPITFGAGTRAAGADINGDGRADVVLNTHGSSGHRVLMSS
ncbi:MAG: FG-GAP-like repeat-containing protein [Actinomycetota bacterium]|nr:FG-GAP-like repeat-containing protein [Actinomycetota bacterium]